MALEILVSLIIITLTFDFINGFHDSANAIATVVATRVLRPVWAVTMAAVGNFVGMFLLTNAIAETVGKGIVSQAAIGVGTPSLESQALITILAAVVGAIGWDIITWWWGLPTSSSHALVGGLIGAASFAVGLNALLFDGITKILVFMVVAPLLGLGGAFLFAASIMHYLRRFAPSRVNWWFRHLQLFSAFFYSVTHGTNDAQKGIGIITLALVVVALGPPWGPPAGQFHVPLWVLVAAHAAISLGTFFGGWRIVRTMSQRVTKLVPWQGFSAESAGGLVLFGTATAGIPVSTTHVISGAIMGVGATRRLTAVRWGLARKIVLAWVFTIPAAALVAAAVYALLSLALGLPGHFLGTAVVSALVVAVIMFSFALSVFRRKKGLATEAIRVPLEKAPGP